MTPMWLTAVVVTALVAWAVTVDRLGMGERRLDASFEASNRGDYPWVSNPDSPTRSGGPRSTVTWDSIGQEGRDFIYQGVSATEITDVTGAEARAPALAYIGLGAAQQPRERARLAMAELEALGGFDRGAIAVAGVTGRGWIDPQASQTLQYVTGGDIAIVGMQYSYLPSWMALLVGRERAAQDAGFLFDALLVELKELPPDQRPKVYVFGESLGAFSAESAFSSVENIPATTDGALFIGPPSFSPNWQSVQLQREPGSPLWKPVYAEAGLVQVAESESDLTDAALQWRTEAPVIYLVNDSDPVVGWTVDHGEWLDPRGPDTSPHMRDWPIVTTLQATVDQFGATAVLPGHGHVYDDRVVSAWSEIVSADLTADEIATIRAAVDDLPRS